MLENAPKPESTCCGFPYLRETTGGELRVYRLAGRWWNLRRLRRRVAFRPRCGKGLAPTGVDLLFLSGFCYRVTSSVL